MDNKIIQVALDGLENILKVGDMDKNAETDNMNRYAMFIEEAGGMERIHAAQNNANEEIYMKAYNIIEKYFSDEDDETGAEIQGLAPQPQQDGQAGTFSFGAQPQQGGFNFANGDSMDM
jgi:hypothetical protein